MIKSDPERKIFQKLDVVQLLSKRKESALMQWLFSFVSNVCGWRWTTFQLASNGEVCFSSHTLIIQLFAVYCAFFSRAWFYFQSFDLLITIVLKNCNCVNCFLTGNLYFDKFKLINLNITVFRGSGYVSYLGVSPHFGRLLVKHWGLTYLKRQLNAQSLSLN